jgi:hypothetical protein
VYLFSAPLNLQTRQRSVIAKPFQDEKIKRGPKTVATEIIHKIIISKIADK